MYVVWRTLFLFLLTTLSACGGGDGNGGNKGAGNPTATYSYQMPAASNDGWAVGHLDDHGIDSMAIESMVRDFHSGIAPGIDGIAIVRNNTLVLQSNIRTATDDHDHWGGNTRIDRHIMHSTSKSVTSALIGIAVDQGYIADADVPFYDLFLYPSYENWDDRKATMTLDDALTMRFGYEWDEWSIPYGQEGNDLKKLTDSNTDQSWALLDLVIVEDPGSNFVYNTAGTIAIGQALENAVGVPMEDFAETHLFQPLQIDGAIWGYTPTGLPNGGSGLYLETRDMAKFGQLFIDDGIWQGQQIISAAWVERSVQPLTSLSWTFTSGYGLQWWVDRFTRFGESVESYSTRGYGGQYIFCVPALQLVVVFTGQNYENSLSNQPFELMQDIILPAVLQQ
jgi:CubicO group peptidase (beta-lactamase class C family)